MLLVRRGEPLRVRLPLEHREGVEVGERVVEMEGVWEGLLVEEAEEQGELDVEGEPVEEREGEGEGEDTRVGLPLPVLATLLLRVRDTEVVRVLELTMEELRLMVGEEEEEIL